MIGIVSVLIMLVFATYAFTTPEERRKSRRKTAKWNPLFIAIIIAGLAIFIIGAA